MKKKLFEKILMSLTIVLLAFPYIVLNRYGNSPIESYVQFAIITISTIIVIIKVSNLIICLIKKKKNKPNYDMLNYIALFIGIFILLMEDALVYDKQTMLFFTYGALSLISLFEIMISSFTNLKGKSIGTKLGTSLLFIVGLVTPLLVIMQLVSATVAAFVISSVVFLALIGVFSKKIELEDGLLTSMGILMLVLTYNELPKVLFLSIGIVNIGLLLIYIKANLKTLVLPLLAVPFMVVVLTVPVEEITVYETEQSHDYAVEKELSPMYFAFDDYFDVGISVPLWFAEDDEMKYLVGYHFNSITAENIMKAEYTLDEKNRGSYTFEKGDSYISYANRHEKVVRGHALSWYNQTPDWFFKKDYKDDGEFVSRDEMLMRLDDYVKNVVKHYEGTELYAWDVVNEGMEIFSPTGYRESNWYHIIGPDYIEKTFEYARKYSEGTDLKLFYNDFNLFSNKKKRMLVYDLVKDLKEKGLVDGVGIQTHVGISLPSAKEIDETIKLYGELGLEVQITELDVSYFNTNTAMINKPNNDRLIEQGYRYHELFEVFKDNAEYVTSVTFWGIADYHSWLGFYPSKRNNWPLVFDNNLKAKPAYYGIVDVEKLPKKTSYSFFERIEKSMRNILDID